MGAKKALKKLKKTTVKTTSRSAAKLADLSRSVSHSVANDSQLKQELTSVSQQALLATATELAKPLNPLLSWFNEGGDIVSFPAARAIQQPAQQHTQQNIALSTSLKAANQPQLSLQDNREIARLPLKSPPCKRCPALANGMCKCAAKKFGLNA
ncbi:hypothetical protein C9I98_18230 [Photobacterium sanctipauli]|uniref:Uncharacterized protein n=1 Tax=Photobacterium sanctipauli TaxID=1342794 RepID=A0A2T3NP50_9GAMM|nr:hypothetical protein [Photobacterium sanctipauli]PSW18031.1 hypothetical protein C9I98_18230 [Photobacterium sanctipauli]